MKEKEFKPGDVVMLKSSGPPMTVIGCSENGEVHCMWMSSESPTDVHKYQFPPETIRSY